MADKPREGPGWDRTLPWNKDVEGEQVLPLINIDAAVIRVRAGPGTGKTFGIRRRVLRIMHPDGLNCPASDVLVCSFNRAIAKDLEDEIKREFEQYSFGLLPTVRTIHSLAVEFAATSPRFLLPHEIEAMMYDVLEKHPGLRTAYPRLARSLRAIREHEAGLKTHGALITAVRNWMSLHHCHLVGDTPRELERRLSQGDEPKQRYEHVVVDEFQDLTEIEAKLVLRLRTEAASFVAVGDRKQSIYAFRGNADKGLEVLPSLVAPLKVLDLTMDECRRCSGKIVQVSNALMALENEPLKSIRPEPAQLHLLYFNSPQAEALGMAKHIINGYRKDAADKHLVMVTRRKWGYDLRNKIRELAADITTQTIFAEDILETWPVREAFLFLSILGDPGDAAALRAWVGYKSVGDGKGFKAPKRNAPAYVSLLDARGVLSIESTLEIAQLSPTELSGGGKSLLHERIKRLKTLWDAEDRSATAEGLVRSVLDAGRWVTYAGDGGQLAHDDMDRLRAEALAILEERQGLSLTGLVRALRYRIATREPLGEGEPPQIRIVTLWGAKGLTADYVYLCGLADEALPGRGDPESTGLNEAEWLDEQRRLLYVSLTRAKRALVISRPKTAKVGELSALGMTVPTGRYATRILHLTRFLGDLDPGLFPEAVDGAGWGGLR
jgi:DNA helicase-2/ATP-dependent DNA helicase PcrA